jgi:hypothetical protein
MGLTQKSFELSEEKLLEINQAIDERMKNFYENNPDEDPLDSMSVTFHFIFGVGRYLDIRTVGKSISVDLD